MSYLHKRILFVSDNKFMHIIIRDTLKPHNVRVTSVYSAEEAMKTLEDSKPDLVLSDINMPGKSGFELFREIKKLYEIPLVIYSSSESDEDIEEAYASGAKGYIVKKYHNEVLAEKILHFIR